jgi:hypothetical protein
MRRRPSQQSRKQVSSYGGLMHQTGFNDGQSTRLAQHSEELCLPRWGLRLDIAIHEKLNDMVWDTLLGETADTGAVLLEGAGQRRDVIRETAVESTSSRLLNSD